MQRADKMTATALRLFTAGLAPWCHTWIDRARGVAPPVHVMALRHSPAGMLYSIAQIKESPKSRFAVAWDFEVLHHKEEDAWVALAAHSDNGRSLGGVVLPDGTVRVHAFPQATLAQAFDHAMRVVWLQQRVIEMPDACQVKLDEERRRSSAPPPAATPIARVALVQFTVPKKGDKR